MSWFRGRTWWRLDGDGKFGSRRHPLPHPPERPATGKFGSERRPLPNPPEPCDKKAAQRKVIEDSSGMSVNQSCITTILTRPDGYVTVTIAGWNDPHRPEGSDGIDAGARRWHDNTSKRGCDRRIDPENA